MAQLLLGGVIGAAASLALAYWWRHRLADLYTAPAVAAVDVNLDGLPGIIFPKVTADVSTLMDDLTAAVLEQQFATCGWSFATEDVAGVPFDNGRIPTTCPGCGNYVDLIPDAHRAGELHIVEHPVLWDQDADR